MRCRFVFRIHDLQYFIEMGFKIITLDMPAFTDICAQLQAKIEKSGFRPDVIVPVPRGGNRVVSSLFTDIPKKPVALIRPPKGKLKRFFSSFLQIMPMFVLDILRIAEAKMLVKNASHMSKTSILLPELNDAKNILIVDDAIDSGATLKVVVENLYQKFPGRDIRSAVITVTGKEPSYEPDYCIFNNQTIIRTPWALDMPRSKRVR